MVHLPILCTLETDCSGVVVGSQPDQCAVERHGDGHADGHEDDHEERREQERRYEFEHGGWVGSLPA